MHLDIDAFFASVEQILEPKLKGKPVIVGYGCIASCSYEARQYGLQAGMSMRDAIRRCPDAIVLDGHYQVYRCFAEKIFETCLDYTPSIETFLDEAYGDLTGTERIYSDPVASMRRLQREIRNRTGLSVTIGVGSNRMVAKMVSKTVKPSGVARLERGEEAVFIRERPVRDLPGVGPKVGHVLESLNVHTIGELRRLSVEALRALFGENGAVLFDRCRGIDSPVIDESEIPRSISRETSFHRETIDRQEIEGMIYYLSERAARALRRLGLLARTLTLKLRYADFEGESARRSLVHPTRLDEDIFRLALRLLEVAYSRRAALRLVGVTLSNFVPEAGRQMDLLRGPEHDRLERLYDGLDRLRSKYGHSAVVVGRSLDLLRKLRQDQHGFVLRTPSLTK